MTRSELRDVTPALGELADLAGVLTHYDDWQQQRRVADPDVLVAVLRALGVAIDGARQAESALEAERLRRWLELADACAVVRPETGGRLAVRVPARRSGRYRAEIALENGDMRRLEGEIEDLSLVRSGAAGGLDFVELELPIPALPPGYHHLHLAADRRTAEALVIAAPEVAFGAASTVDRGWGVFAPTYSLRSDSDLGAGNLAELMRLSRWVHRLGGRAVGALPMLATYYDDPFEPSPYSPVSRLFWNELFIDLRALAAELDCAAGRARLAAPELAREVAALRAESLVDYRRQMQLVRSVIEEFSRWAWSVPEQRDAIETFIADRPRVDDYARFRATVERRRTTWHAWPERARNGVLAAADYDDDSRRYHVFAQYVLARQLGAFKQRDDTAGLYLDLPVGVNRGGYDVWADRGAFALDCSVGAPPDALFRGGQNWFLPPLNPERQRREGYRYFIDCARAQLEHASLLRIDHVMGLHRLYWIPEGAAATQGVYVRYPAEELYAILCLESHRERCALVGEDLGTVSPEIRPTMERHGLYRLFVAQFALPGRDGEAPAPAPASAVASFGTHDTPTFAGFWRGADIDDRAQVGLISAEAAEAERAERAEARRATAAYLDSRGSDAGSEAEVMRGVTELLADSDARLVLVTLEDLWLEPEPQNVPGTGTERPNWRRKLGRSLDEIETDPDVRALLQSVGARRGADGAPRS